MKDWSDRFIDQNGRAKVQASVERNERRTSAEIVPVIVHSSSGVGHVPWMLALFFLLISAIAVPFVSQYLPDVPMWAWELTVATLTALGSWLLSRSDAVCRALTPDRDELIAVDRRALLEFHLARVQSTSSRTGVLVFVSALERRAVVLADKAISEKLAAETWTEAVEILVENAKAGDFATGLAKAIDMLGDRLSREFPPRPGDENHLADHLIIKP